ncbi:unnamed protein product [Brachionus calyciflorus]|uniref:Uncharacterized protein n=1 Tax=Brachionus calyciflorus TaxID=104777 RepID=A0A813YJ81_9BILA|nr:unnamed protein product [Brachionus calyciflorus]
MLLFSSINGVVVYCCAELIDGVKRWHVDVTFKAAPALYKQLYQIHAWDFNEMHACVFILLTNKTVDIYITMLENLILAAENLRFILNPDLIVRLLLSFYPGIMEKYSIDRANNEYSENASIWKWLNYFKSLHFVPFEEVDNVFLQIISVKPSESVAKLDEFISYFK